MTVAGLHLFLRITARTSGLLFLPAFALRAPDRRRGYLFAGLGVSHTAHLAGIVAYATLFWPEFSKEFPPAVLVVASLLFAFLYYIAAQGFFEVLGRRPLGPLVAMTIAEYLVASVFLIEFSAKAALQYRLDVAFALLAAAAWVTRLISARSRRQQFAAAAAR